MNNMMKAAKARLLKRFPEAKVAQIGDRRNPEPRPSLPIQEISENQLWLCSFIYNSLLF